MVGSINNNASALRAFSRQIGVSANNIANVASDEFKKSRAINIETKSGGVDSTITKINTPGPLVEDPLSKTGKLKELSNTDIAEEFTDQIIAENGFKANVSTIKTHDQTIGSLIDMMG